MKRFAALALTLTLVACAPAERGVEEPAIKPATHAEAAPGAVKAHLVSLNTTSKKYHEASCRYYDCGGCVTVTHEEAQRQGGAPCKRCH